MMQKFFLISLALIVVAGSLFFSSEEDNFSPAEERKENISKGTHFTRLINFFRNIFALLMLTFILLVFGLQK